MIEGKDLKRWLDNENPPSESEQLVELHTSQTYILINHIITTKMATMSSTNHLDLISTSNADGAGKNVVGECSFIICNTIFTALALTTYLVWLLLRCGQYLKPHGKVYATATLVLLCVLSVLQIVYAIPLIDFCTNEVAEPSGIVPIVIICAIVLYFLALGFATLSFQPLLPFSSTYDFDSEVSEARAKVNPASSLAKPPHSMLKFPTYKGDIERINTVDEMSTEPSLLEVDEKWLSLEIAV